MILRISEKTWINFSNINFIIREKQLMVYFNNQTEMAIQKEHEEEFLRQLEYYELHR